MSKVKNKNEKIYRGKTFSFTQEKDELDEIIEQVNRTNMSVARITLESVINRLLIKYDMNTVLNLTSEILHEKMKVKNVDRYEVETPDYSFKMSLKKIKDKVRKKNIGKIMTLYPLEQNQIKHSK